MIDIRRATRQDAQNLSALNLHVQKIHADAYPKLFKQPADPSFAVQFMDERLSEPSHVFFIASLNGVDIWSFNQQSRSFFEKHGFEPYNHKLWKTI